MFGRQGGLLILLSKGLVKLGGFLLRECCRVFEAFSAWIFQDKLPLTLGSLNKLRHIIVDFILDRYLITKLIITLCLLKFKLGFFRW